MDRYDYWLFEKNYSKSSKIHLDPNRNICLWILCQYCFYLYLGRKTSSSHIYSSPLFRDIFSIHFFLYIFDFLFGIQYAQDPHPCFLLNNIDVFCVVVRFRFRFYRLSLYALGGILRRKNSIAGWCGLAKWRFFRSKKSWGKIRAITSSHPGLLLLSKHFPLMWSPIPANIHSCNPWEIPK